MINQFIKILQIQKYASNTISSYKNCIEIFIKDFKKYDLEKVTEKNIENYIYYLISKKNYSSSYQRQTLGAIGKFYLETFNKNLNLKYLYPKRSKKIIPKIISKEEIKLMITLTKNLKHKSIICILYSGGLRLSELINLKLEDIDSYNMLININQSKVV